MSESMHIKVNVLNLSVESQVLVKKLKRNFAQ